MPLGDEPMPAFKRIKVLCSLAALIAAMGCGAADSGSDRGGSGQPSGGAGGSGSTASDFGNSEENVIPAPPPASVDVAVRENVEDCKIGHYTGVLDGTYRSPMIAGFPVDISTDGAGFADAFGGMAMPGFEFWLEGNVTETTEAVAADCGPDVEFCFEEFETTADYVIDGGVARGLANGLFPFEFEIRGALDCAQGEFHGLIENGWYDVFALRYTFDGTMDASYDATKSEFFDGTWAVTEPVDRSFGGEGGWYTVWTP